ncbi:MAG: ferrochelatase [Candidatus Eremiobacteraeota bacterium]|nr:ferrochelatase [Candidatus Eremiobacteraeota bacterium]MBC5827858.1 ferrochelatase [Candidatus Eremiobacteraeota bacterium]
MSSTSSGSKRGGPAGVVLLQLGGPEKLADVRPFLNNFFVDLIPDNIPVPKPAVRPLAFLFSSLRAPYSRRLYASIGGGSPLRNQTELQAQALRSELAQRAIDARVYVAMRNWRPDSAEAVERAQADGVERMVALPLYPQYSFSTTRSSVNELRRVLASRAYAPQLTVVDEYCEDPKYISAMVSLIRRYLAAFQAPANRVHLVFSAHGLPVKYVQRGDPYFDQVLRTMAAINERLDHPGPVHLSFQSRLGPEKWLGPASDALIARLGKDGASAVCVVPIAFVSEHVETLNEIDILYASVAKKHRIAEFRRVCAVKSHPDFIACLADHVERALEGERRPTEALR